jgi:hypothetical protein
VEGNINRLKMLKRQMFDRANLSAGDSYAPRPLSFLTKVVKNRLGLEYAASIASHTCEICMCTNSVKKYKIYEPP